MTKNNRDLAKVSHLSAITPFLSLSSGNSKLLVLN